MYAVVVTVESDATREDEVAQHARAAIPRTKAREGFELGLWLRSRDSEGGRRGGRSVLVFDTEEHADAFATGARQGPPAGAPVTLRNVEVFEVIDEVARIKDLSLPPDVVNASEETMSVRWPIAEAALG